MSITAAELARNVQKYLVLATNQDILITIDGKVVAQLGKPKEAKEEDKVDIIDSLVGILPATITLEEAKTERLAAI